MKEDLCEKLASVLWLVWALWVTGTMPLAVACGFGLFVWVLS